MHVTTHTGKLERVAGKPPPRPVRHAAAEPHGPIGVTDVSVTASLEPQGRLAIAGMATRP